MKKSYVFAAAGVLSVMLAMPFMAEEDVFETEITIDLDDMDEDGDEALLDLDELFADLEMESEDLADGMEEEPMSWYVVQYHDDGQDTIMLNDMLIVLPESWSGKYDMILKDDRVSFYHTASRAGWALKGEEGGLLFSLCASEEPDYDILPSFQEMGQGSDGLYYYMIFPTDLQAYPEEEEIMEEYSALWGDIGVVKEESFALYDLVMDEGMEEEMSEEF